MTTLFLSALALGLVFNAAPGAVFAETIRQGAKGGFKPALAVQLGSLAGDALSAVLGLAGVGLLLQVAFLQLPIGIAGTLYLVWLSWDSWQEASKEFNLRMDQTAESDREALRSGILLSITNPQNIAYWAALGSAMSAVGVVDPTAHHYVVFFVGFMISSLLWAFVCAGMVARAFSRSGRRWTRLTYRACAVIFLLLAISSFRNLWDAYLPLQEATPLAPTHREP